MWLGEAEEAPRYCEVWAENWQTVEVFQALDTQWRVIGGMVARVQGIDYAAIPPTLALMGIRGADRRDVFEGLRVMEQAVLETWYPQKS